MDPPKSERDGSGSMTIPNDEETRELQKGKDSQAGIGAENSERGVCPRKAKPARASN